MATRRQREAEQRAAREERERRLAGEASRVTARRRRFALGGAGALAVLVLAAVLVLVLRDGDGGGGPVNAATAPAARAPADALAGIPQDGLVLGNPDAPYTLVEFGDLVCPGCKIYAEEILPRVIEQYVKSGQLRFELRPFGFVRDWSTLAAQYAWAAASQDKLWQFVDAWYANQGDEDTDYVNDAFARRVGAVVPGLDGERMIRDAHKPETRKKLDDVSRGFLTLGFEQAPAFAAGKTGEPVRPIDLGSSPQTASAAISQLVRK